MLRSRSTSASASATPPGRIITDWTLTHYLSSTADCEVAGNNKTWPNVARWTYGFFEDAQWRNVPRFLGKAKVEMLRKIVVVNAKKAGGSEKTNTKLFLEFFNDNNCAKLLAEQLKLYGKLDYIVCCGAPTGTCLEKAKEYLNWGEYKKDKYEGCPYYIPENKAVAPAIIDFYHPQYYRKSHEYFYKTLMEIKHRIDAK